MRGTIRRTAASFGSVLRAGAGKQRNSDARSPRSGAAHPGAEARLCLCCQDPPGAPRRAAPLPPTAPHAQYCSLRPPPSLHPFLGKANKDAEHVCLYCKLPTLPPPPPLFCLLLHFFQNGKRDPSPFPVPPCHVPKVPTNLQCPACTQPPLIAPAFSSGVSSAIATAAPPPPGNSHLHYHSLLQSRPQAPGSEQQLR